jgi:lipoprotein Spr
VPIFLQMNYNPKNMNKLVFVSLFLFMAATGPNAAAQTSVNKINSVGNGENTTPVFIDGISFTPDGILRTTESGGTKSIKTVPVPVVTSKKAEVVETTSPIENMTSIQYKYAMMMDVDIESLCNLSLFGFIDDWFGTRYRLGGTTKKGIDCSALTGALLLAVYGFSVPRTARQQYNATDHIEKEDLKEGDLVFFNTRGGVSHVGVYLENDYFLHASTHGVTISSLDDSYYSKRFICGGRVTE